ncbi:MAG: hypothetical protein DRJ14_02615 [Acidobacteria bacterium]|nr:MAG: hypothetical protein DRJ14_02615 [Acidobacteriota bacterium]
MNRHFNPLFFATIGILMALTSLPAVAGDINEDLTAAVKAGNRKEVDRLINLGDLYVAKNYSGQKALLFCSKVGDFTAVKKLLDAGCDINARAKGDKKGWTALMLAIENGNDDIAALLIRRGAKLTIAPKKGGYVGWHPLQLAIKKGKLELVRLLLDKGAKVDIRERVHRMTPLMIAASTGNVKLTQLLLEKGASLKLKDKKGWTPLIHAVESGSLPTVKVLVEAGANVNERDGEYLSVLQHAAARATQLRSSKNPPPHFEEVVHYLESHGAKMIPSA